MNKAKALADFVKLKADISQLVEQVSALHGLNPTAVDSVVADARNIVSDIESIIADFESPAQPPAAPAASAASVGLAGAVGAAGSPPNEPVPTT